MWTAHDQVADLDSRTKGREVDADFEASGRPIPVGHSLCDTASVESRRSHSLIALSLYNLQARRKASYERLKNKQAELEAGVLPSLSM